MRAIFLTTNTNEVLGHVRAWESAFGPVKHVTFNHQGIRNDHLLIDAAAAEKPEVIFYIGAVKGTGNPRAETYRELRTIAPLVNLCSDAADKPWHGVLAAYANHKCFDLQVSLDGGRPTAIDISMLTPVDPRPYEGLGPERDIRCGFSGGVGHHNQRAEIVRALECPGGLTVRERSQSNYEDHVLFIRRCRMILNTSFTGTGQAHHIKGRVLEAGWAGCALLESEGSPICNWFPPDCYLIYRDPKEAAEMIRDLDDETIERTAKRLAEEVRARYTAKTIYGEILRKIGLVPPC